MDERLDVDIAWARRAPRRRAVQRLLRAPEGHGRRSSPGSDN